MTSKKIRKIVSMADDSKEKLDFLKELFACPENSIFIIALNKLYREYKE